LDRKLRFFQDQLVRELEWEEANMVHLEFGDVPLEHSTAYDVNDLEVCSPSCTVKNLTNYQAEFEELETELHQLNTNIEALKRNYNELIELEQVLAKGVQFFSQVMNTFIPAL